MLTAIKNIYRYIFPAHSYTYSHGVCVRTCSLTGVVEEWVVNDLDSYWEVCHKTPAELDIIRKQE